MDLMLQPRYPFRKPDIFSFVDHYLNNKLFDHSAQKLFSCEGAMCFANSGRTFSYQEWLPLSLCIDVIQLIEI